MPGSHRSSSPWKGRREAAGEGRWPQPQILRQLVAQIDGSACRAMSGQSARARLLLAVIAICTSGRSLDFRSARLDRRAHVQRTLPGRRRLANQPKPMPLGAAPGRRRPLSDVRRRRGSRRASSCLGDALTLLGFAMGMLSVSPSPSPSCMRASSGADADHRFRPSRSTRRW